MKIPLMFLIFSFVIFRIHAQSFEGTIKWKMSMEITDPAMKAQMEEAQRKMNDPAHHAKMKEMQERMNDPEFKAMMDANPQMKAQMEKMMSGGDMNSMMPKGMTVKIKNKNSLMHMEGGMMDNMDILYQSEANQSVRINHADKTYSILNHTKETPKPEVKVTKTSETAKILDYNCTKYLVESTMPNGKPMRQFFWATKDLDIDMKGLARQRISKGSPMFYENIDGVPLKMETKMPGGSMIMEVTEIKKETLNQKDFQIPSDYKQVEDFRMHH